MSSSIIVEQTYLLSDKYKSISLQILTYCFANDIPLSKGELETLTHFYVHGISDETDTMIVNKGIFKNIQTLKNIKTKFLKNNFLLKEKKTYSINNFMNIGVADKIGISIRAANKQ